MSKRPIESALPPRQMHLEEAVDDGYSKMWGDHDTAQSPEDPDFPLILDPEAELAALHVLADKRRPPAPNIFTRQDAREAQKAWRAQLERWGFHIPTQAERQAILEQSAEETVAFLKAIGVWDLIMKQDITMEDLLKARKILQRSRAHHRDPTSSVGVTIYDTKEAMAWEQTHDRRPKKRR